MLKNTRKIICVFVIVALLSCSLSVTAQPVNIDAFLINAGFPQEVIDKMSTPQKQYLYEDCVGENIEFCGYEEKEFVLTDEGELTENDGISLCGGLISSSDMTISVTGTRVSSSAGQLLYYKVYPVFKWHTHKKVDNDSFAMAMYPGWEAIPGERNLRLHLLNNQGQSVQYVDLDPAAAASSGYIYKIPSGTGALQGLYEGYARYNIDKVSSTASPRISLYYAHDASPLINASYSLSIYGVGISISGNTNHIYTMSDNFYVAGLDQ